MNLSLKIRIKLSAARVLLRKVGIRQLLKVAPKLSKRAKCGEPWQGIPSAVDIKDSESRELIGEAILLYRELLLLYPQHKAMDIVREVVIESAVTQLKYLVPTITKEKINRLSPEERLEEFNTIIAQFPNADYIINTSEDNEYEYAITRCRLVELVVAAGHPELSDVFCQGDGVFFIRHQPDILFSRNSMIGCGDKVCLFNFKLKK